MTRPERRLADAVGQLLLRDTRVGLHATVVDGVAGVDATTYPRPTPTSAAPPRSC